MYETACQVLKKDFKFEDKECAREHRLEKWQNRNIFEGRYHTNKKQNSRKIEE